jgi:hypothetical protein
MEEGGCRSEREEKAKRTTDTRKEMIKHCNNKSNIDER